MEQNEKYTLMTTAPVGRLIGKLAVPTVITMLITSIYNMADTYFVGLLDNTSATGAVGGVFSFMAIIQACGFLFGQGSGNYISRMLGSQRREDASRMASFAFFASVLTGGAISVLGMLFLDPLARLLGSTKTILPYAREYLRIILLGVPWMTGALTLNNQLRFQGAAFYSMIGIGSGGLLGQGPGNSRQKHLFLPEPQNDFVFAIVCEELGFIRAVLIILLFILLVARGFIIGLRAKSRFEAMLAMGISFQVGLQAALNMAVVTSTVPNTGISLPFFSYGGTALLILLACGLVCEFEIHKSRSVVHRATIQTGERHNSSVVRCDTGIGICKVLLTTARLVTDKVWIGATQARRTDSLVTINHNIMLGSLLHGIEVVVYHKLAEVVLT